MARKGGKILRDNFAPNPTEALDVFGMIGKILSFIINYLIAKPIYWLVYGTVGLIYQKGKHPAWFGSVLYTLGFFLLMGFLNKVTSWFLG